MHLRSDCSIYLLLFLGGTKNENMEVSVRNFINRSSCICTIPVGSSAGFLVAILLIAAGITAIVVRKSIKKGAHIALIIMYGLAAIIGFTMAGSYEDLKIWAGWCLICAILAVVAIFKSKNVVDEDN